MIETSPHRAPGVLPPHDQLLEQAARQFLGAGRVLRRVLRQTRATAAPAAERDLNQVQFLVLRVLDEEAPVIPSDLAERCHVAGPTMSKTLNQLEAQGLVARHTDPRNRREVQVTLTPAGQTLLQRAEAEWFGHLAQVLSPLSDPQLQDLIVAFGHLERLAGPDDRSPVVPATTQGV